MRHLLFLFAILAMAQPSYGQTPTTNEPSFKQTFQKEQYIADLNDLVDALTHSHPRPYQFISQEAFQQLVQQKRQAITSNTTYSEFIWMCSELVTSIGCGHTNMIFFNQESKVVPPALMMPLEAVLIDNKLLVLDPLHNQDKVAVGQEIMAINGQPVETILEGVYAHISADANNPAGKTMLFNGFFQFYMPYHFGFPTTYDIQLKGQDEVIQLAPQQFFEFNPKSLYPSDCQQPFCYQALPALNAGLLTISSFDFGNQAGTDQYRSFIKATFKQLQQDSVQHLIVDMRKNMGGPGTNGHYLLKHLAKAPFTYFDETTDYHSYFKMPTSPAAAAFQDDLTVLIGNGNFSSVNHVLSLLKYHKRATFVGEETGGTYTCNDNSRYLSLPHTGINIRIAQSAFTTPVSDLPIDQGILPNHRIVQTIDDYLGGKDAALEYAKALIQAESSSAANK
ncbi:MAG: S41 family peptidase [Bacteroidota bacterium]